MGTKYTKGQIEEMVECAAMKGGPLYKAGCINQRGTLKGSTENTSEVIAAYLLSHPQLIGSGIRRIRREKTYDVEHSDKPRAENSNREEELLAIQLVIDHHAGPEYGTMIAYQIPLKDSNNNRGAGKIDLVSYHADFNKMFMHEFKHKASKETLLRCVLEIYTYFSTIDQNKMLKDFGHSDAELVLSVLVYEGSRQHKQFKINENVKILMKELNVEFHVLEDLTYDPT